MKEGGALISVPPSGAPNVASWGPLGALLGDLGAVFGASWGPLGPSWGPGGPLDILRQRGGRARPEGAVRRRAASDAGHGQPFSRSCSAFWERQPDDHLSH